MLLGEMWLDTLTVFEHLVQTLDSSADDFLIPSLVSLRYADIKSPQV